MYCTRWEEFCELSHALAKKSPEVRQFSLSRRGGSLTTSHSGRGTVYDGGTTWASLC